MDKSDHIKVIKKALPVAMIKGVDNYDDISHGYDICPSPGILIEYHIGEKGDNFIWIEKYALINCNSEVKITKLYKGIVTESDMKHIEWLLKNNNRIG